MTNHASHYVFVYGSLRRGFQSPAHEYISHYFNFFGDAKVKGKLFDLGEHPGGVPTQEDSFIIGELYIAKDDGEFDCFVIKIASGCAGKKIPNSIHSAASECPARTSGSPILLRRK